MHEMNYVTAIVNKAFKVIDEMKVPPPYELHIQIGEMTGAQPEFIEKYYKMAVKGTLLEGAKIFTEMIEVKVKCDICKKEYLPNAKNGYRCTYCGSTKGRITDGRNVVLKSIVHG